MWANRTVVAIYCDVIEKMDIGERFEESAV